MSEVALLIRVRARTGRESDLRNAIQDLIQVTRSMAGCLQYLCHQSGDGSFVVLERWASRQAMGANESSVHFQAYIERVGPVLDGAPTVEFLTTIEPE